MMPEIPTQPPAKVDQPGWPPTNKLMTGVGATMLTNIVLRLIEQQGLTEWLGDDVALLREFIFLAVSGLIGLAVGYFFRDKPNQVAEVAALERTVVNAGLPLPPKPEGNTP